MADNLYNCPSCGNENRPGARFCDSCGAALSGAADTATVAVPEELAEKLRAAPVGERKHVTVLFADVSGSMDLAESVDAEAWRSIMDRFFALLCEGVHAQEGTVVQFTGDGIMALFGAPIAHEDHALRAARAALALNERVAEYAAELRRDQGLNFSTRMGLNSGEVVVGGIGDDLRVDYTAIGHTVGLAQRMESLAEPGKIYVTEYTAALLEGFFALSDLGRFGVKGTREPLGVAVLEGLGAARSRFDVSRARGFSRFVGREREIGVLADALERALAGEGCVVGVAGEAGIGKSRLCHEFVATLRTRGLAVYEASAAAHARNVPFHTALEHLRSYFAIRPGDDPRAVRERVAGRLLLLDPGFAEDLALIFDFLGVADPERPVGRMDPEARKRRLHAAVEKLVEVHADREPAVNLIEDLHWIDAGSEAFLETLVQAVPGRRTLVVVNYRPEFRADWMAHPWFVALPMTPLGPDALDELLDSLLGSDESLQPLRAEIAERTAGNPFFVEEVVRGLVEQGALDGPAGDRRLVDGSHGVTVPESVHAVLAARIDRLDAEDKRLLQTASVLGREFGEALLARAAGLEPAPVAGGVRTLVESEFVARQNGGYEFVHPLTQEVAYGSLLAERRREVHAAVAAAIEELHPDELDERAALLASHHAAAGDRLQAARWHARAAAWAGPNDSVHSAEQWRRVREHCDALPETPETIALGLVARVWILQFEWRLGADLEETEREYAAARELAARSGDEAMTILLMTTYAGVLGIAGSMRQALPIVMESVERAERLGDTGLMLNTMTFASYCAMINGEIEVSRKLVDRGAAMSAAEPTAGAGLVIGSPRAWFPMMRSFVRMIGGDCSGVIEELEQARELAQRDGDVETEGWVYMMRAQYVYWTGVVDGGLEAGWRAIELGEAQGSTFSRVWTRIALGLALSAAGDLEAARTQFADALELIHSGRTAMEGEAWALHGLARVRVLTGEAEAALHDLDRVRALIEERGILNGIPSLLSTHATALRELGRFDEASRELDEAERALERYGVWGFAPRIWLDRADLARACEDTEAECEALEQAHRAAEAMGAAGYAAQARERLGMLV